MKTLIRILCLGAIVQLGACQQQSVQSIQGKKTILFARHFQLVDHGNFQELILFSPRTHAIEGKFALIPRGKKVQAPSDFKIIETPVKNCAVLSTTFIGMLKELNALSIISATTDHRYIANDWVKKRIQCGAIKSVTSEGDLRPEDLIKRKIALVIYSGFGQAFPNQDKLEKLNIVVLPNYDWEETNPLGKAEWIKLFGALTNKNEEAKEIFDDVCANYIRLKHAVQQHKSSTVALMGAMSNGIWYAPSGTSFLAGIAKDAGLTYVYAQTKGAASIAFRFERIYKDEVNCDVWINAESTTRDELIRLNPKVAYFHTVRSGNVFSYMHDSNFFWEMSAIHPDWLLSDFSQIAGYTNWSRLYFYRKIK